MGQADTDIRVFLSKMTGQMFGALDRTVLASGAAEADHEIRESPAPKCLHMRIDHPVHMIKEAKNLAVLFEETDDRFVSSRKLLIWFISSRIVD